MCFSAARCNNRVPRLHRGTANAAGEKSGPHLEQKLNNTIETDRKKRVERFSVARLSRFNGSTAERERSAAGSGVREKQNQPVVRETIHRSA